jgi:hypothetical protein
MVIDAERDVLGLVYVHSKVIAPALALAGPDRTQVERTDEHNKNDNFFHDAALDMTLAAFCDNCSIKALRTDDTAGGTAAHVIFRLPLPIAGPITSPEELPFSVI